MPVERANEHPVHDLGGTTITSLAAPSRGATEVAPFRTEVPPGGGLPRDHHDHLDVFTVERGGGEVAMLGGTKIVREDGSQTARPWVG
jgi:quercetin dioxygenase-like cupin family protein